jgi:hypothetical protein
VKARWLLGTSLPRAGCAHPPKRYRLVTQQAAELGLIPFGASQALGLHELFERLHRMVQREQVTGTP